MLFAHCTIYDTGPLTGTMPGCPRWQRPHMETAAREIVCSVAEGKHEVALCGRDCHNLLPTSASSMCKYFVFLLIKRARRTVH